MSVPQELKELFRAETDLHSTFDKIQERLDFYESSIKYNNTIIE